MDEMNSQILNFVIGVNEYHQFTTRVVNEGYEYYSSNRITDVKLESAKKLIGNVKGTKIYTTTLEVINNKLVMSCTCPRERDCKHQAALVKYVKMNNEILDIDYILSKNQTPTTESTIILLNKIKNMTISWIHSGNRKYLNNFAGTILDYAIEIIKEDSVKAYDTFFQVFSFFITTNISPFFDRQKYMRLYDTFIILSQTSNPNILSSYKKILNEVKLEKTISHLVISETRVDSKEKADVLSMFLDATYDAVLKLVRFNNSDIKTLKDKLSLILIRTKLNLLNRFDTVEFKTYFEKIAPTNEEIESEFFMFLHNQNDYDKILDYMKTNNNYCSTGEILFQKILFSRKSILIKELKKNIINIFSNKCKYIDFLLIKQILRDDEYNDIKDKLLRQAKKTNKNNYIEIEIFLDKENGYNIAKNYGIIEFDKHHQHFLPEKYLEIISIYQEGLTDIFSQLKGTGSKFQEAINAIYNLMKLENGKYYAFSIYRMSKEKNTYMDSEALDGLRSRVYQLDL